MPIKLTAAPASAADRFTIIESTATGTLVFNVRANDGKNASKPLYSLDNGQSADLAVADPVSNASTSTDRSALGATIWINADGKVGYSAASIQALIDALAPGETLQDSFLYAVKTSGSAVEWSTVQITFTGSNDAPVASADVAAAAEGSIASGNLGLNDGDVDHGAVLTFAALSATPVPGFTLASDGNWTFDANNEAYNNLAVGETQSVRIDYRVTDQYGASSTSTLTITVTGSNDAPRASVASHSEPVDEGQVVTGRLFGVDADNGAVLSFAPSGDLPAGASIAADGSYRFDADHPAYQSLAAGETVAVTLAYRVTDEHGASALGTVKLTVRGTNDAPVASAASASLVEDTQASGQLAATDPDNGTVLSYALAGEAQGFTLGGDGRWTFDASGSEWQALREGEARTVSVPFIVSDEQGGRSASALTITLVGRNDSASMTGTTVIALSEDDVYGSALVTIVDPDTGEGDFADYAYFEGTYGYGWFGPAGPSGKAARWSYEVADSAAVQALAEGETAVDHFVVTSVDGTPLTFTVLLTGANDAPETADAAVDVTENATIAGQLIATDVDKGGSLRFALVGEAPEGFSLGTDGHWTFDAGAAAYDALVSGDTRTLAIAFEAIDDEGARSPATLSVTIAGANDAPVAPAAVVTATENTDASGGLTATDADAGATLTFANVSPVNQAIAIAADGSWRFFGNDAMFQSVAHGETRDFLVGYSVTDQFGAQTQSTVTVRVAGVNDAPTLTNAIVSVYEDLPLTGRIVAGRDVDAGAVLAYQLTGSAPAGFELQSDGRFTMLASDATYQSLGEGQVRTFSVGYRVTDEWGASADATLTINVTGRNDAPILSGPQFVLPTAYQGQSFAISEMQLLQGWTDADGDLTRLVDWPQADHATLTYSNGRFLVAVEAGYTGPLTLSYGLSDGRATAWTRLTTTVTDAARISGATSGTVVEARYGAAGMPTANGALTIVDVGDDATFRPVTEALLSSGGYGSFTVTTSGTWTYTLDNSHAALVALNAGQTLGDSFTLFAADGTAQRIEVTINGATDWSAAAPYAGTGDAFDYDTLLGAAGTDNTAATVTGTELRDVVTGGDLPQNFTMLGGDDLVYAGRGDDRLDLGAGADSAYAQSGNDVVDGGLGNDNLYGGLGDDQLLGGDGFDQLYGGSGRDTILGGAGRDIILGGYGADTLTGGLDGDTFIFNHLLDTGDTLTDFQYGLDGLIFRDLDANSQLAGDQAFAFSFAGPAANALWTVQNGANLEIFADVDGNANTAEFSVILLGVTYDPSSGLVPSNFTL